MNFDLNLPYQKLTEFITLVYPIGLKVISAIVCGGLIGIEREVKSKPAGLKTNILICLGATLYTIMSVLLPGGMVQEGIRGDPGRVAAQIVSGIGFLGAGAIMRSKFSIHGLTTAATIWVVAAIGVCIGAGYPVVAFAYTVTVLFTLLIIDKFESKFFIKAGGHALEICYVDKDGQIRNAINQLILQHNIEIEDFDISQKMDKTIVHMHYAKSHEQHKKFVLDLWKLEGITEVAQL